MLLWLGLLLRITDRPTLAHLAPCTILYCEHFVRLNQEDYWLFPMFGSIFISGRRQRVEPHRRVVRSQRLRSTLRSTGPGSSSRTPAFWFFDLTAFFNLYSNYFAFFSSLVFCQVSLPAIAGEWWRNFINVFPENFIYKGHSESREAAFLLQ